MWSIPVSSEDEVIRLSYWNTPKEAFGEYKKHKQADILIMADKYKNEVLKKVYDALLRFEVKLYQDMVSLRKHYNYKAYWT